MTIFSNLSKRELEIVLLLVQRKTNKQIAQTLEMSPETVKKHLRNIFSKLQARNRSEVAVKARQSGCLRKQANPPD